MVNRELIKAIKLHPVPQYKLAWQAGINPVVLSQIITGYIRPAKGDQRVVRIGEILGFTPKECFEMERNDG